MVSSFLVGLGIRGVDLIWGTSPPLFQAVSAWLLARVRGVPFVLEVRDLWPLFAIDVGVLRSGLLISMSRWLERFLYRRADYIVVNSPGFIEHIQSRGGGPISLIPNGVDLSMFPVEARGEDFRKAHGLSDDFVVLYAGAHGLSNDLQVAIEAAAELEGQGITFVLVGAGKEKAALQRQVDQLGVENVRFIEPIPKNQMSGPLAAADVCLAILKPIESYKTTFPNKVFDYMAAGRPVLLAIDGVIRQVVDEAGAGVFVQPGNPTELARAIVTLRSKPARAQQMGVQGRRYVEDHFARDRWAEELSLLFQRVISAAGKGDA